MCAYGRAAGWGMTKVSAQAVNIDFSPGVCPAFISTASFDKLNDRLKEAVYESAWEAQKLAYEEGIKANDTIVGCGPNPSPDSNYQKLPMRDVRLSDAERAAFADRAGVEQNMDLYSGIRAKLDDIGGFDTYGAIKEQADAAVGKPINMQKWWT